jgi:fatty-acyl-CoA synthase
LFATGNGLRPEYWDRFQLRYGIDCVQEFYGSTEGTLGFTNRQFLEDLQAGKRVGYGAVGRLRDPRMIICKFDVEAEQLLRGADGLCRQAAVDEAGELLVRITSTTRFAGYTDPSATEKKLACDVLEKGDRYFRTGDLLRVDAERFVYFVDRIGDTFRWKGENVSTAEVASELAKLPGIEDVNVYGVQIPNTDGRAGCCAMVMADTSSDALARFHQHATASLPAYAVPLFLRVLPRMQTTETFKHQKVQLRNEGIDPSKIEDSLYFLDEGKYQLLDDAAYQRLTQPSSRL